MAKKKVVDAEILLAEIDKMTTGFSFPYTYPNNSGSIDAAVQNAISQNNNVIAQNVSMALMTFKFTLKDAILKASRDEDGGLCGLCRVDDNACMPMDFRPAKLPDPNPPAAE